MKYETLNLLRRKGNNKMTEEEMIIESQKVINNWTDELLWYMQEYKDLGYEKIAGIFIINFALQVKQIEKELTKADEEKN